jgi:hypothetical protein
MCIGNLLRTGLRCIRSGRDRDGQPWLSGARPWTATGLPRRGARVRARVISSAQPCRRPHGPADAKPRLSPIREQRVSSATTRKEALRGATCSPCLVETSISGFCASWDEESRLTRRRQARWSSLSKAERTPIGTAVRYENGVIAYPTTPLLVLNHPLVEPVRGSCKPGVVGCRMRFRTRGTRVRMAGHRASRKPPRLR